MRIVTLLLYDTPAQTGSDPASRLPAFEFVLGRGARTRLPQPDPISWLCSRFGLARQPDWPVAPLLARAASLDATRPVWLCADPVHIELRGQRATIIPAPALSLSEAESAELVAALDLHFCEHDLRFFAFDRTRWLINTSLSAGLHSGPLPGISGGLEQILGSGPDAARWNALLTEAQMLLHAHPVNTARQAAGKPEINGLHLWGAGTHPRPKTPDALVASNDPLTLALSAAAGVASVASTGELVDRLQADASALVVSSPPGDAGAVADCLLATEREWLAPLLHCVRRGRIDRLELVAPQPQGLVRHTVTPARSSRLWNAMRSLGRYFAKAPTQ
ncbi:MAG: hypothetical protein ACREU7_03760 [Burkholderiales bacterium]